MELEAGISLELVVQVLLFPQLMLSVSEGAFRAVLALAEVHPVFAHLSFLLHGVALDEVLIVLLSFVLLLLSFESARWEFLEAVKGLLVGHLGRNIGVEVRNSKHWRLPARQNFLAQSGCVGLLRNHVVEALFVLRIDQTFLLIK